MTTRLIQISGKCNIGGCPTVFALAESDDLIVQGYDFESTDADPLLPDGEGRVRIPRSLIEELVGDRVTQVDD